VRSYLAVSGGVDVEPVLGSRSTDTLAHVGPPVLATGQVLPVGAAAARPSAAEAHHLVRRSAGLRVLRFRAGPRVGLFPSGSVDRLCGAPYTVSADSNRVGLRLHGEPLVRDSGEAATEGIVLGAVQVPPSGQPLVFLADHPTTGGYPVLGVVHRDDLAACAQLRPGEQVRFAAG
jgi:allophanate hydrolase subunit 2